MSRHAADFALVKGRVWSPAAPAASAIAAAGGRIVAIGAEREIADLTGPRTRVVDAAERRVLPGLIDAHLHFLPGGLQLRQLDLTPARGRSDFVARIVDYLRQNPGDPWLQGGGWSNDLWPDSRPPDKSWIDALTDRPAFLLRLDRHAALVNSAALAAAGITRHGPPDPPGGRIDRHPETAEPTGLLRDAAIELVRRHIPPPSASTRRAALRDACRLANELGLTMVHNMLDAADVDAFRAARDDGALSVRVCHYLHRRPDADGIAAWRALQPGDDRMRCAGCKNYMDGSLGSRTAWMLAPYADAADPANPYGLRLDGAASGDDLLRQLVEADAAGLQLCAHAIGDAANRALLDLYQAVARHNGPRDRRPRVEHAQHLDDADVPRFAPIGAVASMQPIHKFDDGAFAPRALPPDRTATAYRFRDLLDAGTVLAFGSDWPIAPLNPFLGVHAAVTGRTRTAAAWLAGQNLTLRQALRAYTAGPAYACFMDDRLGRLAPGYYADLVVCERDPLAADSEALREIRPVCTVVGGAVVWSAEGGAMPPDPPR